MSTPEPFEKVKAHALRIGMDPEKVYKLIRQKKYPHLRTPTKKGCGGIDIPSEAADRWRRGEEINPRLLTGG